MDHRRLILAALLSLAVLILWQMLFAPPKPVSPPAPADTPPAPELAEPAPAVGSPAPREGAEPPEAPQIAAPLPAEPIEGEGEEEVVVETDGVLARFTNRGAQLLSFRLRDNVDPDGEPLELVRRRQQGPFPFALVGPQGEPLGLNDALFDVEQVRARDGGSSVVFRYHGPLGTAEKRFELKRDGLFGVEVTVPGQTGWGVLFGPGVRNPSTKEMESRFQRRGAAYMVGGELGDAEPRKAEEPIEIPGHGLRWIGLEDTYFLTALIPERPIERAVLRPVLVRTAEEGEPFAFQPVPPEGGLTGEEDDLPREFFLVVEPGTVGLTAASYWGPKQYDQLASFKLGLERTIRWGMFGVLTRPLQLCLNWFHDRVVQNYGWAIVLTTLFIKILLFPLTHKSYVSMQKLQKLNPRMEAIRQKYRPKLKDKKGRPNMEMQRKMNEEMQALFRQEGVNPAGGCLPMLLQIPVFFAFFNLLRSAVELWNAPWILWIRDLSVPDPWYVLPIVMGGTQFLQQKMTPAPTNPSQRILMTTMPIWFTIISLGFPSGLVLYWLTNNVLTIFQQGGYNRLKRAGYLGGEETDSQKSGKKGKRHEPGEKKAQAQGKRGKGKRGR